MKDNMNAEFGQDKLRHVTTQKDKFYIVDYTERTNSAKSVEVLERLPPDIPPLKILNPTSLNISTTIFKPQCFMDGDRELKQCEGVMYLTSNTLESFIIFIEIKDCKPKNVSAYHKEMKEKFLVNIALFRSKGIIPENKIVYAIASFPRKGKTNFHNHFIKATEWKQLRKEHKLMIKGTNSITIKDKIKVI
ncbi:conserved hypothetical protein [Tenacibaculum maritimum]|uniref:hypothetical protein n=1 Tax=Tenacibaculum maritimum TaxID=107401 RepID=UPI0012E6DC99|nr:hypothetical protein [Tenacibaculum maritimum]CAA0205383.1 conserved hypothetical protein [Tenacibaculum maritimum]